MSVIITILWILFWIWAVGTIHCFAQLMHEGITGKDPKAFVREWTDFFGMFIYLILSMVVTAILMVCMITQPSETWQDIKESFGYWFRKRGV